MSQIIVGARRAIAVVTATALSSAIIVAARAQNAPAAGPSLAKQAVENRKATYTLIGNYFRYFGAVAKGAVAYDEAEAARRATRIAFLSELVDENFPDGSNVGEPDSKAKADIWSNRADFDKRLKEFRAHAAAFVETTAREKGATEAFKVSFAALGQDCKGCHDNYKIK